MFDTDTVSVPAPVDPAPVQRSSRVILGKWRNAVSVIEDEETGEVSLHRFNKRESCWMKLMYFSTMEDFEDFLDFCDGLCPEDVED